MCSAGLTAEADGYAARLGKTEKTAHQVSSLRLIPASLAYSWLLGHDSSCLSTDECSICQARCCNLSLAVSNCSVNRGRFCMQEQPLQALQLEAAASGPARLPPVRSASISRPATASALAKKGLQLPGMRALVAKVLQPR